jgi:hypothetical protein
MLIIKNKQVYAEVINTNQLALNKAINLARHIVAKIHIVLYL